MRNILFRVRGFYYVIYCLSAKIPVYNIIKFKFKQEADNFMINKSLFGTMPDGRQVYNYTFIDSKGQSVTISEYACAIIETKILAQDGNLYDVTLGYDTLNEYLQDTRNFGAIIGRYANRIAGGKFTLNGVTYYLPKNNGRNTLHGGFESFRKKLFTSTLKDNCVEFRLESPD